MSAPLRPLSLGELLDQTFSLYRSNFLLFVGIVALPQLLTFAANLSILVFGQQRADPLALMLVALESLPVALLSVVVLAVAQGAVVIAVSHLHLGHPVSISAAYSGLKGRMMTVCFASLATGFLEGIGLILLIVPGILLAVRWALVIPVVALEQVGVGDSMSRSSALTKGHRGRIFMIFVLYAVLLLALNVGAQTIESVVTGSAANLLAPTLQSRIIMQVLSFFTQCLVGPTVTIAMALVYYDERVRKEAFDLEHMLSELDAAAPAIAPFVTTA